MATYGYFEYVLQAGHERLTDPLNPRRVHNGLGAANFWFRMPDAAPSPLILRERGTARGYTTHHLVRGDHLIAGGERVVYLYQPPVEAPCPLLVVWDGRDYLRRARIRQSVENLIAARRIEPVALALVEHGRAARFMEYACSESTLAFLMRHVLPLAQTHLRLVDPRAGRGAGRGDEGQAGAYGVLGASMGGLMALYTGLRLPDVGRVLSQSGAFGLEIGGRDLVVAELIRQVRPAQSMRPAVWMDCGRYEWWWSRTAARIGYSTSMATPRRTMSTPPGTTTPPGATTSRAASRRSFPGNEAARVPFDRAIRAGMTTRMTPPSEVRPADEREHARQTRLHHRARRAGRAAPSRGYCTLPLLYKVLFANSCVICSARRSAPTWPPGCKATAGVVLVGFVVTGLIISVVINFVAAQAGALSADPAARNDAPGAGRRSDLQGACDRPGSRRRPAREDFNTMLAAIDELSKSRASQILHAQEQERKRIARELHDETSQVLTSLLISLALLEESVTSDEARARSPIPRTGAPDVTGRAQPEHRSAAERAGRPGPAAGAALVHQGVPAEMRHRGGVLGSGLRIACRRRWRRRSTASSRSR